MANETPTPSPPPFQPQPLQPTPKYLQLHLPGTPWYYFHEFLQTYMSNRAATESAIAFSLGFNPDTGKLTLGDAEINLTTTDQWTAFSGQGPMGIHRMAIPISSLMYHLGGVNRLPGRRVFADGMYKVAAGAGANGLDVTVKVGRITGAGEADFEGDYSEDYVMGGNGCTRGERSFRVLLEGIGTNERGWTVVGAEGVEFQGQEVPEEGV